MNRKKVHWRDIDVTGATILVVDDLAPNRELLEALLEARGYTSLTVENGLECLEVVKSRPVDLILLDIMMPEMDGFEVLKRLKDDPQTSTLPVIVVTALDGKDDRIRGLEMGADEFVTKPVDRIELYARIENLLRSKHFYDSLESSYRELEELEKLKEALTNLIVHDLKNPLSGIQGFLQMIEMKLDRGDLDKVRRYREMGERSCRNMMGMITDILDLAKMDEGGFEVRRERINLVQVLDRVIVDMTGVAETRKRFLERRGEESVFVEGDRRMLERVFTNLVGNSLKFTKAETAVILEVRREADEVVVKVLDHGPGIPAEYCKTIFDKFSQIDMKDGGMKGGHGLGLAFCQMAVDGHDGRIEAFPPGDEWPGGRVEVRLPLSSQ